MNAECAAEGGNIIVKCVTCGKNTQAKYLSKKFCPECLKERDRESSTRGINKILEKNPNYRKEYNKKYKEVNRDKVNSYSSVYRKRYKQKHIAHQYVYMAVKTGKLQRPNHCEKCLAQCKPEAHHKDYTKPLDIEWLCVDCHNTQHDRRKDKRKEG